MALKNKKNGGERAEGLQGQRGRGDPAGGVGWGGREKGCFGDGVGVVLCTYIAPKRACDGGVKNGGWGRESGQKETLSGHKKCEKWAKVL